MVSCITFKKVLKLTTDSPWIILNSSIKSALTLLLFSDHNFSLFNCVSSGNLARPRTIRMKCFWIFSISFLSFFVIWWPRSSAVFDAWSYQWLVQSTSLDLYMVVLLIMPNILFAFAYTWLHHYIAEIPLDHWWWWSPNLSSYQYYPVVDFLCSNLNSDSFYRDAWLYTSPLWGSVKFFY